MVKDVPSSLAILVKASKTFLYPLLWSTGNLFYIRKRRERQIGRDRKEKKEREDRRRQGGVQFEINLPSEVILIRAISAGVPTTAPIAPIKILIK